MKNILLVILLCMGMSSMGQEYYGAKELNKNDIEFIKTIPKYKINRVLKSGDSDVSSVDNTLNKWFPPIINQTSNSCGCASNVHYIFTYEVNRMLDRDASKAENIFHYMQTWNFLNGGKAEGTYAWDVYEFIRENGAVTEDDFMTESVTEWPYGYEKYHNGMRYKIESYSSLDYGVEEEFETMKQYIRDGGLVEFEAYAHPLNAAPYFNESELKYKAIIPRFGNSGMHAMTVAGYDDTVWYDYNKDGIKDDFEMGAFLCVNSWGSSWGDTGRFYAPYYAFSTLKQTRYQQTANEDEGGTGNGGTKICYIQKPKTTSPQLTLKLIMSHTSRDDFSISVASLASKTSTSPNKIVNLSFMKNQGGNNKLRSSKTLDKDVLEFGADLTGLFDSSTKYYSVTINNKQDKDGGKGKLMYCAIVDYRDSESQIEYIADINSKRFSGRVKIQSIVDCTMPELEEGINTQLTYVLTNKSLNINLKSLDSSYAEVDIMGEDGSVLLSVLEGEIPKGVYSKSVDISSLEEGEYTLRINSDNTFVYKTLEIK